MPIYEYVCTKCQFEFEQIQKFSDPLVKKCPSCGGKVEKKLSLSSFQLKGTGWYLTDYSKKNQKPDPSSKKTEKSGSSESKSDVSTTQSPPSSTKA